jgi:hypothetical protein
MNAEQATSAGGVVSVSVGRDELSPAGAPVAACVEAVYIAVRDQGTGIPPEQLPQIVDPFFTTKEVSQGTGLAALARGLGIADCVRMPGHRSDVAAPLAKSLVAAGRALVRARHDIASNVREVVSVYDALLAERSERSAPCRAHGPDRCARTGPSSTPSCAATCPPISTARGGAGSVRRCSACTLRDPTWSRRSFDFSRSTSIGR